MIALMEREADSSDSHTELLGDRKNIRSTSEEENNTPRSSEGRADKPCPYLTASWLSKITIW